MVVAPVPPCYEFVDTLNFIKESGIIRMYNNARQVNTNKSILYSKTLQLHKSHVLFYYFYITFEVKYKWLAKTVIITSYLFYLSLICFQFHHIS
jgi:hypothetical protein